ncbi:MAG TPA: SDR family oxidoreductase [Gemmataceae bacterium]|jgi:thioester reductase-like protein|nr:SDR family oxidoreductase [Gemmataceae bacterium]
MLAGRGILLTGATGFLGRYLLGELLSCGHRVAVLVRDSPQRRAADRVAELVASLSAARGQELPRAVVVSGELGLRGLGLSLADRQWLGRRCQAVLHTAADISFHARPDGEPWRTNLDGTRELLRLCRELGLRECHHVSTAYVCGRRRGAISEEDLDRGQGFNNPYEQSKFEAERSVRLASGLRATVYRPAVIVGDSRTGYTSSYAGLYRFLELGSRLAQADPARPPTVGRDAGASPSARRWLPLRLPLSGNERCNLVPVDWVAKAVVSLLGRPSWHGRTFHLVSRSPVTIRAIQQIAAQELGIEGVEFAGAEAPKDAGRLDQLLREGLREYWPYLAGQPEFLCPNTRAALPGLAPPAMDGPMLRRLIHFAVADDWGRARAHAAKEAVDPPARSLCASYLEEVFPRQARKSRLAKSAGLNLLVALDIRGPGGGQWSCRWIDGELSCVTRGLEDQAEVTYQTDTATFAAVVQGRQSPQQAFFEQRIDMRGNLETALKLAVLFEQFLRENPYPPADRTEAMDATPCPA